MKFVIHFEEQIPGGHSESGTQLLFSFLTVPLTHRQPPVVGHVQTGPIPWKLHFTFGLQQVGGQIPSPHMLGVSFCPHIIGKTFASIQTTIATRT